MYHSSPYTEVAVKRGAAALALPADAPLPDPDFVGREWVFRQLHTWLETGGRFFHLVGEPGSGKSALSHHLVHMSAFPEINTGAFPRLRPGFLDAAHFCSARDRRLVNPLVFAESIGSQLAAQSPVYMTAMLKASGLTYTILKPGPLMEMWLGVIIGIPLRAGQPVTLVGEGARKQAFTAMDDVVAYAVAAVENPRAYNQEILIAGAPPYSWTEAVAAVGRVAGQPIPIRYVQPGEAIPLIPPAMGGMLSASEMADSVINMGETAATYGIAPTSVDAFAQQFFGKR